MDLTKIVWILPKLYGSYHGSRTSQKNPTHIFKIVVLVFIFDDFFGIIYNQCIKHCHRYIPLEGSYQCLYNYSN
jgi:hypothetical protein